MKLNKKEIEHLTRKISRAYYRACSNHPDMSTKVMLHYNELADIREALLRVEEVSDNG